MGYKEIINNFKTEIENRINMYKTLIERHEVKEDINSNESSNSGIMDKAFCSKLLLIEAESILGILNNLEKDKKNIQKYSKTLDNIHIMLYNTRVSKTISSEWRYIGEVNDKCKSIGEVA